MAAHSCLSKPFYITDKSSFGGVGGAKRQLLDKFIRPLFVPDNKPPHHWSSTTAAARQAYISNSTLIHPLPLL